MTEQGLYSRLPSFRLLNAGGRSPVLLVCEHASRFIPGALKQLGLDDTAAQEHIAWDIGALDLAEALAERLDAPLLAAGYSRLLIDLNRPLAAPDSIPSHSEIYPIPGNLALSADDRRAREKEIYQPFHRALSELIDARLAAGVPLRIVGVHSFTPVYRGVARPWTAGVLFGDAERYATRIVEGLRSLGETVGANQPYSIHVDEDTTVPVHGDARGIDAVLLEIRNDGLRTAQQVQAWAEKIAPWL